MKKNKKNILLWVLTGFMAISALVYFPSIASIIMLLFSFISAPIKQVQDFWKSKKLFGITKGVLLVVLFFVSIGLAPSKIEDVDTSDNPQNISTDSPQRNSTKEELEKSAITVKPDEENKKDIDTYKEQPFESIDNVDDMQDPEKEEQKDQKEEQQELKDKEIQPQEPVSDPVTKPEASQPPPQQPPSDTQDPKEDVPKKEESAKTQSTNQAATSTPTLPKSSGSSGSSGSGQSEDKPNQNSSSSGNSSSSDSWGESSTTNEVTGSLDKDAYWVDGGKSYHFTSGCTSLSRSKNIRSGTLQDALNAGKTDPCNNCAGGS